MAKEHAVTREDHANRAAADIQGATLRPDPSAPLTWQVYRYQTDTHVGTVSDRDAEGWLSARPGGVGAVLCVSCLLAVQRLVPGATRA